MNTNIAKVTAIREDGRVNISYQGSTILAAACLDSYQNRAVGDNVHVVVVGGYYIVTGRMGADASYASPAAAAQSFANYLQTSLTQSVSQYAQIGATPGSSGTEPLLAAWSYYNGSTNTLVTALNVVGINNCRLWMARLPDDGGIADRVPVELFPHAYDTLPNSAFAYSTAYTPLRVGLQRGQVMSQLLPADWVTALKAGTIKGVCAVVPSTSVVVQTAQFAQFSATAGGYTTSA